MHFENPQLELDQQRDISGINNAYPIGENQTMQRLTLVQDAWLW